ncbi:sigma-70 family RNA polymerase sigma factor, partial [Micromonospora sp. KC606]|uniref:sigma-70 family RNA polymerase sigma factor n=1 Tax=Micromonospora sp. KC606 TaxID=2530379 RepID=UPI00104D57B2
VYKRQGWEDTGQAASAASPENRLVMLRALAAVPPRQRAVLVLRYWEDQSIEDVAALLGCSPGTVKSQAARGLDTLRGLLTPTYSGTEKGTR